VERATGRKARAVKHHDDEQQDRNRWTHGPSRTLTFSEAATEIAQALNIKREAAEMTLYGLCATGNVGSVTDELEIIDGEECTIEELEGSLAFVSASDVRHWLTEWSPAPQPLKRDAVIEAKLQAGAIPGRARSSAGPTAAGRNVHAIVATYISITDRKPDPKQAG